MATVANGINTAAAARSAYSFNTGKAPELGSKPCCFDELKVSEA